MTDETTPPVDPMADAEVVTAGDLEPAAATDETPDAILLLPPPNGHITAELRDRLDGALADLREAETEHASAREQAKAAKEELDACHRRLQSVAQAISDQMSGRMAPALFDEDGHPTPDAVAEDADGDSPAPASDAATLTPEQVAAPIPDMGLTEAMNNILAEANITTVGELHTLLLKGREFWNKDIRGLGGERAGKVLDAFYAFIGWTAKG